MSCQLEHFLWYFIDCVLDTIADGGANESTSFGIFIGCGIDMIAEGASSKITPFGIFIGHIVVVGVVS